MARDGSAGKHFGRILTAENLLFAALLLIIAAVTIYYRVPLLKFYGFYEPDGFYHYAVVRAAINAGFAVPHVLGISGYPAHAAVTEPSGLYWVTLFPYAILQYAGVSYYTVMRLVPVLFAILDIIGAIYLLRYFNKDRFLAVLVGAFIALSMGDAARTSATIYRGDGFVTIFVILALIFMLRMMKTEGRQKLLSMGLSGFFLSVCNFVWNGSPFAVLVYLFAFVLILLYGFITENRRIVEDGKYILGSVLIWYALANVYLWAGLIGYQTLLGPVSLVFYAFLVVGWYIASYITRNAKRFKRYLSTSGARAAFAFAFIAICLAIAAIVAGGLINEVLVNGFTTGGQTSFGSSIQELEAPSPSFFFSSFGPAIYTTLPSMVLYISSFVPSYKILFWLLFMVSLIPYLFLKVEHDGRGKFLGGKAVIRFGIDETLLVLISFYALTAYLQIHVVRFNSLVAVPLAIFAAYTFYWIALYVKGKGEFASLGMTILMIFFLVSVYSMLAYSSATERLYVLVAMTVITVAFMAAIARIGKRLQILYRVVPLVLIALFFVVLMNIDWVYASSITQADSINYGFISAMQWMGSNTPSNSVALTLWPDGSVVEGVANRTSITDSVGSQKYWIANPFAVWMFNSSKDPQFMLLNISSRPDYMVARYSWFAETSGIYLESGLNLSSSQFAYLLFTDFQEKVTPAIQNFSFASSAQPGLLAHLTIYNGTSYFGYLENSNGISPFADIILYDTVNGSYTELPQHYSATNNNTFVMVYSSIPRQGVPINISYAYTMNYGIAHSNLFRVLYECGANACAWNNTIAGLKLVYANQDTKIFRIVYNATS